MTETTTTPTVRDVPVGTIVITRHELEPIRYLGPDPDRDPRFVVRCFGTNPGIHCAPDDVAPADAVTLDLRDPRIEVEKVTPAKRADAEARGAFMPSWFKWQARTLSGGTVGAKTKAVAVAYAARMLAVADWHAAGADQ